jgi:nucleotide-binding universal stress UspA family protein
MKKVLIALDYDPTAQKVAEKGYALAKSMGAEVTLLHIITNAHYYSTAGVNPILGFTDYANVVPLLIENTENLEVETLKFLERTKAHLADPTIKTIAKQGSFADSILETAKETGADILVMGSHSRRWLENILMGSVTEKVLNDTEIPLFIVPLRQKK